MKALLVIAPEGFQPLEYGTPKRILESAGIQAITASKKAGIAKSSTGTTAKVDLPLSQVNVSDYDAVLFIGGPGAVVYRNDSEARKVAQEAVKQNKVLGAICIAPTILANAGVLNGKKATVWNGDNNQSKLLQSKGAVYTGEMVTVDGRLVTANGPLAAEEFGKKVLELLEEKEK